MYMDGGRPKFNYMIKRSRDYAVDWYYHVKTTKPVKLKEHDNKINYMYEPLPYKELDNLFRKYPFTKEDVFIDIGCGKGRVLLEASLHGCLNIYGIDISKELIACAENNLKKYQKKKAEMQYQLLCMNAKDFTFLSDINKVFIYNPFHIKILIRVLKALAHSIEENPREVMLFLGGPENILKYLDGIKNFKLISIEKSIHVYQYISNS